MFLLKMGGNGGFEGIYLLDSSGNKYGSNYMSEISKSGGGGCESNSLIFFAIPSDDLLDGLVFSFLDSQPIKLTNISVQDDCPAP
jgi:hypothetical protein